MSAFLPRGWDHLVASDWGHPACRAVGLAVRPAGASGHGQAWEVLEAERERITEWVGKDLSVVKIADLLAWRGVLVPYRTLHWFCTERCGFGRGGRTTVRVAETEPGVECQIDFARMDLVYDPSAGLCRARW